MKERLVSIIMPAYNSEDTIERAVISVLNQTYTNWELLIGNDCSTDNTMKIISSLAKTESRIKVYSNDINIGVSGTRNLLVENSEGEFIAFLDSDDEWYPPKLKIQISQMVSEGVKFSCGPYHSANNLILTKTIPRKRIEYNDLLFYNDIPLLTVVVRKSIMEPFRSLGHEDYDLWLRILKRNHSCHSIQNIYLAKYNVLPGSLSSNKGSAFIWYLNILKLNGLSRLQISLRLPSFIIYHLIKKYVRTFR